MNRVAAALAILLLLAGFALFGHCAVLRTTDALTGQLLDPLGVGLGQLPAVGPLHHPDHGRRRRLRERRLGQLLGLDRLVGVGQEAGLVGVDDVGQPGRERHHRHRHQ